MNRSRMNAISAAVLSFVVLFGGSVGATLHEARAEGSSASVDIGAFSVFNPSHLYLNNGTSSISASTGSVSVSAATTAVTTVDSIGITVYVQKWNGSNWETVGSGYTLGGNNASSYSNSVSKSVASGFYYRARTIHWVIENGTYEDGEKFTSSVLVP